MSAKIMLLGDEAIAQAGIDAGMSGIYAYPGTPSTEITEYVMNSKEAKSGLVRAGWSTNEKTAMESALGMSYAGKRAMVCMKHVGLNVAADAFINSAITGANGGLIVVSADDPSMHSSQNEQDSRVYGKFALIPVLEPTNQIWFITVSKCPKNLAFRCLCVSQPAWLTPVPVWFASRRDSKTKFVCRQITGSLFFCQQMPAGNTKSYLQSRLISRNMLPIRASMFLLMAKIKRLE
jgi:hypothetical protein